jgi:hypothetical protein
VQGSVGQLVVTGLDREPIGMPGGLANEPIDHRPVDLGTRELDETAGGMDTAIPDGLLRRGNPAVALGRQTVSGMIVSSMVSLCRSTYLE